MHTEPSRPYLVERPAFYPLGLRPDPLIFDDDLETVRIPGELQCYNPVLGSAVGMLYHIRTCLIDGKLDLFDRVLSKSLEIGHFCGDRPDEGEVFGV